MNLCSFLSRTVAFGVFLLGLGVSSSQGATIGVTNTADDGPGSLRQAVADANDATTYPGADVITFSPDTSGTIALESQLVVSDSLAIEGNGKNIVLSGAGTHRLFLVAANVTFELRGLTLRDGNGTQSPGGGGAIFADGPSTLNLVNCTFANNSSLHSGAVYATDGQISALNCTFASNTSTIGAGALAGGALATLQHCTFFGNTGATSGAIQNDAFITTVANCLFAANTCAGSSFSAGAGVLSNGGNLFDDDPGFDNPADLYSTDAQLSPLGLALNGGAVPTIALHPASRARGLGVLAADTLDSDSDGDTTEAVEVDARGLTRDAHPDAGAFELQNAAPLIADVQLTPLARTDDTIEVTISASDPDSDSLSFSSLWKKNGVVIEGETGLTLDLSHPGLGDRGDILSVVVSVSDGKGGTTIAPEVSVQVQNTSPLVSNLTINNLAPKTNNTLIVQSTATDADGDIVTTTYAWKKNGQFIPGATKERLALSQSGNGDKGDRISVVALVADGQGGTDSKESTPITIQNSPPIMAPVLIISTWIGRPVMGRPLVSDNDGDTLHFSRAQAPTTGGTLSGIDPRDGLFLFRPASVMGKAFIPLQISDGESTSLAIVQVDVGAAPPAGTKIYTAIGDSTALARGVSYFSGGYSAQIERMLQTAEGPGGGAWRLSVRAVSNFSAPDLLRTVGGQSMLSLAVADRPSAATVWIGLNDVNRIGGRLPRTETLQEFLSAFQTLMQTLATQTRACVAVADVPNQGTLPYVAQEPLSLRTSLSTTSATVQKIIDGVVKRLRPGFARVVLFNDPGTLSNFCSADGFHPNKAGYTLVATKMFQALSRNSGLGLAPFVLSVSPQRTADYVGSNRAFQLLVRDANGAADIQQIELLLNPRLEAATGAYLLYSPLTGQLSLRAGQTWLAPIRIGTSAGTTDVLDNGAIRIFGRNVSTKISSDGTTLTLSLVASIGPKLVGNNIIFTRVKDATGRTDLKALPREAGFVRSGFYSVIPAPH